MPPAEIVVWQPPHERPEAVEDRRRAEALAEVREAEIAARKAQAERRLRQHEINATAEKLVLTQLQKLLRLAESPDYQDSPGPVDLKDLIRLAELAGREYRLDTGKATANVAHTVGPSLNFAAMTQEERDTWRRLVAKASNDTKE